MHDLRMNAQITICGEYAADLQTRNDQQQAIQKFFAIGLDDAHANCYFYPLAYQTPDPSSEYHCEKPREILLHVYPDFHQAAQDPIYGGPDTDAPAYPWIWHQYECMETGSSWFSGWLCPDGTMEI